MSKPESIRFYDTASRSEVSVPTNDMTVSIYSCGPTVYKDAHIGNMRAYMTSDLLRRAIKLSGGAPNQVINITDVGHLTSDADNGDDKVEKSAKERGITAWDVAKDYEEKFWEDYDALGMERPEIIARATEHIDTQIALIENLQKAGVTYRTPDGIYFDSTKYAEYADFAQLDLNGLNAGSRVELGDKKHASDFALWKFPQEPGKRDMEWPSPWGVGFPGWHIECSAMSMQHLGSRFDIHTGGIDHIPVHHTNEIAQARAAGNEFADYWLHTAFLMDESGEKMSKSSGVSSRLPTVLRDYQISADALRYMYLSHHFQGAMEFSADKVAQSATAHTRLVDTASILYDLTQHNIEPVTTDRSLVQAKQLWYEFVHSLTQDNLNSPVSIDIIHRAIKTKALSPDQKYALIEKMDDVLALGVKKRIANVAISNTQQGLLDKRKAARDAKDYTASDTIREDLARNHGLRVIDSPAGQVVRRL